MSENTALIVISEINPAVVFTAEGIEPVIDRVEKIARAHVPDVSTDEGRSAVRSLAFKIARSKTALDDVGKEFVAEIKGKVKVVDNARKTAKDRLSALKVEVRKPLTEYEEAEEKREAEEAAAEQARVDSIKQLIATNFNESVITGISSKPSTAITEIIDKISALAIGDEYQEFASDAEDAKAALLSNLMQFRENKEIQEEEDERRQQEADRLEAQRKELEERERKQEEERKAEEARLQAERDRQAEEQRRIDAEKQALEDQKAKEEEERQEAERLEQEAKANAEREEALRPDKEKLVAFADALYTHALTEAGKLGLESIEAGQVMTGALRAIEVIKNDMAYHCDNLGGE